MTREVVFLRGSSGTVIEPVGDGPAGRSSYSSTSGTVLDGRRGSRPTAARRGHECVPRAGLPGQGGGGSGTARDDHASRPDPVRTASSRVTERVVHPAVRPSDGVPPDRRRIASGSRPASSEGGSGSRRVSTHSRRDASGAGGSPRGPFRPPSTINTTTPPDCYAPPRIFFQRPDTELGSRSTLVPTLCVGMPSGTLCVRVFRQPDDAERRGRHSHGGPWERVGSLALSRIVDFFREPAGPRWPGKACPLGGVLDALIMRQSGSA
jgi:hypothetical protein